MLYSSSCGLHPLMLAQGSPLTERKIVKKHQILVALDDPNAELIASFVRREFPEMHNGNEDSILDGVMAEMIGSRQIRLAGCPSPESQVAMREVVRKCIQSGTPIPVLTISGPKKTLVSESIDVAELSAIRTLACLNRRVKTHYAPGIHVRMRMEDTTGYYLEDGVVGLEASITRYTSDFSTLIHILGYDDFLTPVLESTLMSIEQLRKTAGPISELLMAYLTDSEHVEEDRWADLESWQALKTTGWQGSIPREMRQYYQRRYQGLFPEYSTEDCLALTAKYLSGSLARHKLGATGTDKDWAGCFQISFAPPVPGTPKTMVSTRLYYRTVPLDHTKRHMPFWRAKGILKLNGSVRMSLICWNEYQEELNPFTVSFSNGEEEVSVRADYMCE